MIPSFRQRCASALTHPVTIAAVAVLLANDLVLKLVWPGHWVTGKLSDFVWVVFAPPLLVLLLSYLTFRNPLPERAAFLAAYGGLPLAYLAFNSSEAVHRWVLSVLLPLTGNSTGSPFDPTDSLVILPALALALWVWRRAPARPESTRMRLYLFAAVAMALATIATSPSLPHPQSWLVGISDRGTVVMNGPHGEHYESADGGHTWSEVPYEQRARVEWGGQNATTPRGTYVIQGLGIGLNAPSGQHTLAYRPTESDLWAQKYASRTLRSEVSQSFTDPGPLLEQKPFNIVYDEGTSNVIVAMGWVGVAVGTPDGAWTHAAVGEFVPPDLSFQGKARLMLSALFWLAVVAVSLSTIALILAPLNKAYSDTMTALLLIVPAGGIALSVLAFPPYGGHRGLAAGGMFLAAWAAIAFPPKMRELRAYASGLIAMIALAPLPFLLWLADRVTLFVASLGAAALLVLVAGAFFGYLVRRRRADGAMPSP